MSWKSNIQVRDMDDKMRIECQCIKCGHTHYITKASICTSMHQEHLYLDEIEKREKCKNRYCDGKIEILLIEGRKTSPFVGGMA